MVKTRFKYRHQYEDEADAEVREATAIRCSPEEDRTQQQFKDDADLNIIAERFRLAGERMPEAPVDPAYYGDVSEAPDLREILERGREAQERFMALPAKIRSRFRNDPAELYAFVMDDENRAEAAALGLLEVKEPADRPAPVVVTSSEAVPPSAEAS